MSSRQKSFFEQDHGSKVRKRIRQDASLGLSNLRQSKPRWQGNGSFDKKPPTNDSINKPAPSKPPIQPSTQTKSKLKAFEFARHPDKKNTTTSAATQSSLSPEKAPLSPSKQEKAPLSPIKTAQEKPLPSTPAMRLPLADLIGNAEDALRRPTPQEESPVEEIGWIANSSHPDLTPRQRTRRPQSSSPVNSSQNDASDLPDPNLPQSAFKTPRADPAAELWTRYATARNPDETPLEKRIPSFAHLMNDSSPRSAPRTPGGSVGGLRRWASCGLEWPSSRVKRRRVNGIFRDKQPQDQTTTKPLSRVGMLVEKVQESLATKDIPSSSSPLPDKGDFPSVHMALSDHQRSNPPSARSSQQHGQQNEDAEFDDTEITLDDIPEVQYTNVTQDHSMTNTTLMNTIDEEEDEFGDDEFGDELDVEDMENVVSRFESRPGTSNGQFASQQSTKKTAPPRPPPQPSAPLPQQQIQTFDLTGFSDDDDDDDEYGGSDLDEEQFAQFEMNATQALEASTSTSNSVRISNLPRV